MTSFINTDEMIDGLLEDLSTIEHQRWSKWQRYMHSKGRKLSDGSLVIPAEFVVRWDSQMNRSYQALSEEEKESDREQVREYLSVIKEALRKCS